MALSVLWRSSVGADAARAATARRDADLDGIDLRVETDREAAAALRDWPQVLVDGNPDERLLDGAALERVVVPFAGLDPGLRGRLLERPRLRVHNSHFNAGFVAQHALALLLACSNRIPRADRALREGDWRPRYDDGFLNKDLAGGEALLVGYGAIGRALEPMLRGLGMRIRVVRKHPRSEPEEPPQLGIDGLHDALTSADAVMISLPATPETRNLFDDLAFERTRPGAIVVNVGRGEVIDPGALYRALASGRLFGAGLDVWWRYPGSQGDRAATLPADPPLHALPQLVMSPHRANQVEAWEAASFRDVIETLRALIDGGEERNRIDSTRGY